jgi:hypothetical protein
MLHLAGTHSTRTELITSQQRFVRSGGVPSLIVPQHQPQTLSFDFAHLNASDCNPPPFNQTCIIHTASTFSCEGEFHQCVSHGLWQFFVNAPIWCFLACCGQLLALVSSLGGFHQGQVSLFRWIHCFHELFWWNSAFIWIHIFLKIQFMYSMHSFTPSSFHIISGFIYR